MSEMDDLDVDAGSWSLVMQDSRGLTAVFYWDGQVKTEAVLLYSLGFSASPLEQRMWRAEAPMSQPQREAVLASFDPSGKTGITDDARRSVPWGEMQAALRGFLGASHLVVVDQFQPPTDWTVDYLCFWNALPSDFRNAREFKGHVAELRIAKEYLLEIYREKSSRPAFTLSKKLGLTPVQVRNAVERARSHGYLTRADGEVGGMLTQRALDLVSEIDTLETMTILEQS